MPKDSSSLRFKAKDAVPKTAIMHGTHEISLPTVQAMFGHIDGFTTAWTPMYFARPFTDHAMYKAFLETSSPIPTDPITNIRVDFKGIRAPEHAFHKLKERSRVWMFEGKINSDFYPGQRARDYSRLFWTA